jgi:UDP-N-acetylglucosamine diphosphorylase / glucose-1-phosphate thymidylyltransferase / UDP-N-acetylgalactosamine diphosphorylase / glucosamine-1-phosphate N-acetyltransferase / galactosamine-1-phosphate N-acetyltransferase
LDDNKFVKPQSVSRTNAYAFVCDAGYDVRMIFAAADFLDLSQTEHASLFQDSAPAWEALKQIGNYLEHFLQPKMNGTILGAPFIGDRVFIGSGTVIEHGATVLGPAWIGTNCKIRSGCYIRENVIVGNGVVLGNSCEFKNCVVFDHAQIPHFNYVGDSILGYKSHLAAGVILSNVRLDRSEISVRYGDAKIPTGLKKFGAIVGDKAEIGCNSVISPGSIIGRSSLIYPLTHFSGVLAPNTILQNHQNLRTISRNKIG